MTYMLDTNTIIHYLRNHHKVLKNIYEANSGAAVLKIPVVVDYELRRGFRRTSASKKEELYQVLLKTCRMVEMNDIIWAKAIEVYIELRQKSFSVGEMDILIAASCLVHDCVLVTNNTADFENIDDLKLLDWTI